MAQVVRAILITDPCTVLSLVSYARNNLKRSMPEKGAGRSGMTFRTHRTFDLSPCILLKVQRGTKLTAARS